MRIKVLGSGCAKCNQLEKQVEEVLVELGSKEEIEHVTDFVKIAQYGVMATPALVIDDKVLFAGRIPNKDELKECLKGV